MRGRIKHVFVVEGERKADLLREWDHVATNIMQGTRDWSKPDLTGHRNDTAAGTWAQVRAPGRSRVGTDQLAVARKCQLSR